MLKTTILLCQILICSIATSWAQDKVYPVIETYGGIYDVPEATLRPNADLEYKIVVELHSGSESADKLNPAINNVARMMNLHAIGGASNKMDIVLIIHGDANDVVLSNEYYFDRYKVDNPNIDLLRILKTAGVKLNVCGQSLLYYDVNPEQVLEEVEIATSMLTTVTTYQLKGYAFLSF
jgi:intracellular sulfur oxidation DsrE/DsrF family protein